MAAVIHTYYQCSYCSQFCNSLDDFQGHVCIIKKKSDVDQTMTDQKVYEKNSNGDAKFSWNVASTKLLLNLRQEMNPLFRSPPYKKKKLWKQLANEMAVRGGYIVSSEYCDKKWRNLVCTYRRITDQNKKKENFHSHWDFYKQMEKILQGKSYSFEEKPFTTEENLSISDESNINEEKNSYTDMPHIMFPFPSSFVPSVKIDMHSLNAMPSMQPVISSIASVSDIKEVPVEAQVMDKSAENNHEPEKETLSESPPSWFLMYLEEMREQERKRNIKKEKRWQEYKELQERKLNAILDLTQVLTQFVTAKELDKKS